MKPMEVKLRSKTSHWPKIPHRYDYLLTTYGSICCKIIILKDLDNSFRNNVESGINVGIRLLILGLFSRGYYISWGFEFWDIHGKNAGILCQTSDWIFSSKTRRLGLYSWILLWSFWILRVFEKASKLPVRHYPWVEN